MIESTDFEKSFKTHKNYLQCLASETARLTLNISTNIKTRKPEIFRNTHFIKKIKLVNALKLNLEREYEFLKNNKEHSQISCIWMPAKSYYLLYNLCSLIATLKGGDASRVRTRHEKMHKRLKELLESKEIYFSNNTFNKVYTESMIKSLPRTQGYNLKETYENDEMINFILNKIVEMKKDTLKRDNNLSNFISSTGRKLLKNFRAEQKFCLLDYFYQNRIRVNYSDLDFLEGELDSEEFFEYYESYYKTTMNLVSALADCYRNLKKLRS